jgi:hypothetical protein
MLNYKEPYWEKEREREGGGGGFCSSLALGKGITLEIFLIKKLIKIRKQSRKGITLENFFK